MSKISQIRKMHDEELEKSCNKNQVLLTSVQKLIDSEKTKKLLKRKALIQQTIDKEIDNALDHENR